MKRILLLIICAFSPIAHGQKFEQVALTPPMGWNRCHQFLCDVNLRAELPGHDVLMLRPGKK